MVRKGDWKLLKVSIWIWRCGKWDDCIHRLVRQLAMAWLILERHAGPCESKSPTWTHQL